MAGPDSGRTFLGLSIPGDVHTVTDPEQARLLTDPRSKEFFKPFLARERSATQAAAELNRPPNSVLYRIGTFVRAGLLEVTRTEKRAGRAVKHYRSVHGTYFVPFGLTPYATLEERLQRQAVPLFAQLIRSYAAVLMADGRFGQHLLRGPDGAVWTTDFPPEYTPEGFPVVYSDMLTRLSDEEAVQLGHDLRQLFERAARPRTGTDQTSAQRDYFLMVALLPTDT